MKKKAGTNYKFTDSLQVNNATYIDYLNRFKKIALSIFEWVNLPESMNSRWIERCLYYNGKCALFKDKKYGFINTNCSSAGYINIYGLPSELECYSFEYQTRRRLYTGLTNEENQTDTDCIMVLNDWEGTPTSGTMDLFAYRLYEAQRTCDTNIIAQKTPIMVIVDEKQRLTMENLYNQYNGNQPFIFGDRSQLSEEMLRTIDTKAPYIADKVTDYKKEIWNEALTFLGINNLMIEKKQRMITDEASSNNELINLNLMSFLAPRQEACRKFNELFGLTGTDKEISVRVRSDLHNVIKNMMSTVSEYKENLNENTDDEILKEVVKNG
jgi:hypothetical protein